VKVLFIGGTGNISTSVSRLLIKSGVDLYLLHRNKVSERLEGATSLICDINDARAVSLALKSSHFDCAVNWIAFEPKDVERDIALFSGKVGQYIFIGTASSYQKPPLHPVITESTPLHNPYWEYSRNKTLCENLLTQAYRDEGFPVTIVRPSLTYDTHFPIAIGGWGCYTLADRMLKKQPIIVHGDGTSLWTVTHAEDFAKGFVGLIGHQQAIGQAFHITSDEILTWNQIYQTIACALGAELNPVHIPSDFIHRVAPSVGAGLLGDKAHSAIFDNTKIKSYVPGYIATIPFNRGIEKTVQFFEEHPERKVVKPEVNETMDQIIRRFQAQST
jgi:nucleoside-diphosphate-sugar epimerase